MDATTSEMEQEMKQLDQEISTLEELSGASKVLKNKANYLISQLNLFDKDYLADTSWYIYRKSSYSIMNSTLLSV